MAQYLHRPRNQVGRDNRLALAGLVLLAVGTLTHPWGEIPAAMGVVIILAFVFGWMARVIIAGEVDVVFGLLLTLVGSMALALESMPRVIVGAILMVSGLCWIAWRVLRPEAEQARQ